MTARRYVPLRVDQETLEALRSLARAETEGNLSALVRKLIRESLNARGATP